MTRSINIFLLPLKFTFICALIVADAFLIALLLSSLQPLQAENLQPITEDSKHVTDSIGDDATRAAQAVGDVAIHTVTSVGDAVGSAAHTVSSTVSNAAQNIATTITNPITFIQPESAYEVPEIEALALPTMAENPHNHTPAVQSAQTSPSSEPQPQPSQASVWPLKGVVTAEFGIPHRPFQPRHTGIDISSYQPAGRTGVTPFREGTVVETVRSRSGLGNHVIIDHGDGLTSYYCHLSAITVTKDQHVKPGDIVGREGRTGTVTGTHLHFEIRENGNPVNPRKYIDDNP